MRSLGRRSGTRLPAGKLRDSPELIPFRGTIHAYVEAMSGPMEVAIACGGEVLFPWANLYNETLDEVAMFGRRQVESS